MPHNNAFINHATKKLHGEVQRAVAFLMPTCILCACLSNACDLNERGNAVQQNLSAKSNTVRDVQLTVSVPRHARSGSRIELAITLLNNAKEAVFWGRVNGYRDCRIEVLDSAGQPAPLTSFGEAVMGGDAEGAAKHNPQRLDPGDRHTWRFDLAKLFLLRPGGYTVSVSTVLNTPHDFKVAVQGVASTIRK